MPLYSPASTGLGGYVPADSNYLGWTFDSVDVQGGAIWPTAGTLNLARIKVGQATVSNIVIHFTVAGGTLTTGQCFAGLYSSAGVLLSSTADQSTNWQTGGLKSMPLSAAQSVSGPFVYVGFFANGTTMPTQTRAVNSSSAIVNPNQSAPNFRYATADAGLTTALPASFGAQTGAATGWWVALS
jgi:hypothetical protein